MQIQATTIPAFLLVINSFALLNRNNGVSLVFTEKVSLQNSRKLFLSDIDPKDQFLELKLVKNQAVVLYFFAKVTQSRTENIVYVWTQLDSRRKYDVSSQNSLFACYTPQDKPHKLWAKLPFGVTQHWRFVNHTCEAVQLPLLSPELFQQYTRN